MVTQILSGPNAAEPKTLLATFTRRSLVRPESTPQKTQAPTRGHHEIPAVTENGGRRRRPPRAGALRERGGASSLITRDRCSSGLLRVAAHGSLTHCVLVCSLVAAQVVVLLAYLGYLAAAGAILPGKLVNGPILPDSSTYRCNGTSSCR